MQIRLISLLALAGSILFCSSGKAQSPAQEIKAKYNWDIAQKNGKYGVNVSKTNLVPYVHDSITAVSFDEFSLDKKEVHKKIAGKKYFLYLWKGNAFDVYEVPKTIILTDVNGFIPPRNKNDYGQYLFKKNGQWGWIGGSTRIEPQFDSVAFLELDSIQVDSEKLKENGYVFDVNGFSQYANFLSSEIMAWRKGCVGIFQYYSKQALIDTSRFNCNISGYKKIPELIAYKVQKENGRKEYYRLLGDKMSKPYDSIAGVLYLNVALGYNFDKKTVDVFKDNSVDPVVMSFTEAAHVFDDVLTSSRNLSRQKTQQMNDSMHKVEMAKHRESVNWANWMNGLVIFTQGKGFLGIRDASGQEVLPATATAISFGRSIYRTKGDLIFLEYETYEPLIPKYSRPLLLIKIDTVDKKNLRIEHEYVKFYATVKLPYSNTDKSFNVNLPIEYNFKFKNTVMLPTGTCPFCDGMGSIVVGVDTIKSTYDQKSVVKDGSTTVTKKNYLANERVDANGRKYVPTYTQTYDNYKTVTETKTLTTYNNRHASCSRCKGSGKYRYGDVFWNESKNSYEFRVSF